MTNEEAVERIKILKAFTGYDKDNQMVTELHEALDLAIKALEQQCNLTNEELYQSFIKLEAENERLHDALESQRWIPVSSGKLPDEQTHVIVTIGNERFTSVQLCLYTSTSVFWKEYVKAWMPLPEPF